MFPFHVGLEDFFSCDCSYHDGTLVNSIVSVLCFVTYHEIAGVMGSSSSGNEPDIFVFFLCVI